MLGRSVGSLLDQLAANFADRDAVVVGDRRYTYRQYFAEVKRVGRSLLGLGLAPGDRVAIMCGDRLDAISVYYGAMWAGLVTVPLNPRLGIEDHTYILNNTGARVVFYDEATKDRIAALCGVLNIEILVAATPDALLNDAKLLRDLACDETDDLEAPGVDVEAPVLLLHTGGTTGRPKGVTHNHRSLLAAQYSLAFEADLHRDDRFFHVLPLAHAGGITCLAVWLKGATNYLLEGFDPPRLLEAIESKRLTSGVLVPTMIYALLETPGSATRDLSSLRTLLYGAAPMAYERLIAAVDVFGPVFVQVYGQSEAPGQTTVLSREAHLQALNDGDEVTLRSCGSPVLIAEVMLADDNLKPVAHGEVGEICLRGPHVMQGYWNDPGETAQALRDGWLCSGDLARYDAEKGVYTLVDRKKDMIVSGGYNVYPAQLEKVLFGHPAVAEVAVIGVPDDKWGEAVMAIIRPVPGLQNSEREMIEYAKSRAGAWLAPKTVEFVDAMPLTVSNKIDKRALRARFWKDRDRAIH